MEKQETTNSNLQDASYSHVLKYTWLFGGVQGLNMLIGIMRTKVVALFLGPAGLALINIYNNVATLLSQCTNMGIAFSGVKDISEQLATGNAQRVARSVCSVRIWSMLTALVGTLVALIFSPLISILTFGNYAYTYAFAALAPMVGMLAITGGEMAILKGLKCLRRVASASVLCAATTLVVYLLFYGTMGSKSIVPALLLSNLGIMGIHLYYSTRIVPWRWSFAKNGAFLRYGTPFIRLGIAYVVSGAFGQGAEYVMRALLIHTGGIEVVGLYNCGYIMIVSYASLVFMAIESDYFPRLSATKNNPHLTALTVNKQTEICVLLISPILVGFVVLMPFIVKILFSSAFVDAVEMSTCAVFYMFFKSLTLPAAYLPLAHGDSKIYMVSEVIYDVLLALAVPVFYYIWGLEGTGWALTLMGLFDLFLIHGLYYYKYGYIFQSNQKTTIIAQLCLLAACVGMALTMPPLAKYTVGTALFLLSCSLSFRVLNKETQMLQAVRNKLFKRNKTT